MVITQESIPHEAAKGVSTATVKNRKKDNQAIAKAINEAQTGTSPVRLEPRLLKWRPIKTLGRREIESAA